jgi:membrane protein implicated in regulation of membrane protease activity
MMPWWGWVVLGTLLLCAELFAIDAQFYLIFIGVGAIVVGVIGVTGIDLPGWAQWILFAALSLISMLTLRKQLYEKLRGQASGTVNTDSGGRVTVAEELGPGDSCRTQYRGTVWTAVNVGEDAIPAGQTALIDEIDGLNLKIRRLK